MTQQQIILLCVIVAAIGAAVAAFFVGVSYRRKTAERKIGSAEQEADRIKKDAKPINFRTGTGSVGRRSQTRGESYERNSNKALRYRSH